jgi:hypothetical protein
MPLSELPWECFAGGVRYYFCEKPRMTAGAFVCLGRVSHRFAQNPKDGHPVKSK